MGMTLEQYQAVLDRCGGLQEPLANRERWALIRAWRQVYAAGLHAATGRWKYGQYEWHVFSYGHAHALHGERAAAAYDAEEAGVIIVCPELERLPAARLTGGAPPDFRPDCE